MPRRRYILAHIEQELGVRKGDRLWQLGFGGGALSALLPFCAHALCCRDGACAAGLLADVAGAPAQASSATVLCGQRCATYVRRTLPGPNQARASGLKYTDSRCGGPSGVIKAHSLSLFSFEDGSVRQELFMYVYVGDRSPLRDSECLLFAADVLQHLVHGHGSHIFWIFVKADKLDDCIGGQNQGIR